MNVEVKKLNNPETNQETGAILTAVFDGATNLYQKMRAEALLSDYAFNELYPNQGINIYSNVYSDTPSIVVIREINQLDSSTVAHG